MEGTRLVWPIASSSLHGGVGDVYRLRCACDQVDRGEAHAQPILDEMRLGNSKQIPDCRRVQESARGVQGDSSPLPVLDTGCEGTKSRTNGIPVALG